MEKYYLYQLTDNSNIYYSISDSLTHSVFTEDIPEEIFPQSTVHFTLFDEQGLPHAERIVHTSFPKTLDLVIGKDKQSYKPREKVELSIFAQDAAHQPIVFGDFSLAVIDAGKINKNAYEENLLSYFGLTAALKGKTENPAFYLENTTESNKALDDLLLTQGWSRFKWKDLINNDLPSLSYIIEKGSPHQWEYKKCK